MGREEDLERRLVQSILCYVRENYKDVIDRAYEYFWDENSPEDFLSGTALSLGFANFEDWLVFDYKVNNHKERFIELYIKNNKELNNDELSLINKIKDTVLSLYEVMSVSEDRRILLKDLLMGSEFSLRDKTLAGGLNKGDIFAARLLNLDGRYLMSGSVYPYSKRQKKTVFEYINKQFKRYKKNENQDGTMKDFLRDYGDLFNIIWTNLILNPPLQKA